MNFKKGFILFFVLSFLLAFSSNAAAQFGSQISKTYGDKNSQSGNELIEQFLRMKKGKAAKPNSKYQSAVKFTPQSNSGVAEALSDAFGQNADQKKALIEAFQQIKQGYEIEVAKEGKSNDLAAAMAFFISANVMTYYQTEPPSDQVTEELYKDLQASISNVSAFTEMTDVEKQKMHDWLICMGGFAMSNYMDARQSGDAQALANIKVFADYSLRLVFGIEAGKMNLSSNGLNVQSNSANTSVNNSQSISSEIIGTWSRASSSPVGMAGTIDATRKQMVSAGTYRARYMFKPDGTYSFKSEMSPTSNVWWTTEETGSFFISGDTITITPRSNKATLRNLDGQVQKTENKPLETVSYKWKKHYFAGIREMNLVLEPAQQTNRDGNVGGNSLFPNAYLYSQGDKLAWRY